MKQSWGAKLTTIFPRQGHYALDAAEVAKYPAPDLTIEAIGALAEQRSFRRWRVNLAGL